jgi:hypothetical protein
MAEDQGKEEEKFDFTGEGEAEDYVTLDQARFVAMQTAREEPGNYGPAWQTVPMVFEVVNAEETEDDYALTLAFRPEGEFTGAPGQEQFVFRNKVGEVAFRQVLSLPRRGRRFPVLPVAIGLVVVGVIAAVAVIFVVGGFGADGGMAAVAAPTETPVATEASTLTSEPTAISPTDIPTSTPMATATPTPTPVPPVPTPTVILGATYVL